MAASEGLLHDFPSDGRRTLDDGDDDPFSVRLVVDYLPTEQAPLPTMIDLRVAVVGQVRIQEVAEGQAVIEAGKTLSTNPDTGEKYLQILRFLKNILVALDSMINCQLKIFIDQNCQLSIYSDYFKLNFIG